MSMQDCKDLICGALWCVGFFVVLFVLPACTTTGTSDPCARVVDPSVYIAMGC